MTLVFLVSCLKMSQIIVLNGGEGREKRRKATLLYFI